MNSKVCKGDLDIAGCIENDKSKILNTDRSNQSYYADFWRKVECHDCINSGLVNRRSILSSYRMTK